MGYIVSHTSSFLLRPVWDIFMINMTFSEDVMKMICRELENDFSSYRAAYRHFYVWLYVYNTGFCIY